MSLELSLYKAIQKIVPDAAFTLFTGDIVDHGLWNTTQAYNEKESQFYETHRWPNIDDILN